MVLHLQVADACEQLENRISTARNHISKKVVCSERIDLNSLATTSPGRVAQVFTSGA
jgi:hypothetical protein